MKERPILFSAPMVRAILEGRKTQTRRLLYTLQKYRPGLAVDNRYATPRGNMTVSGFPDTPVGYAWGLNHWQHLKVGDRLWVRETWREREADQDGKTIEFRADRPEYKTRDDDPCAIPWRPSIYMPRTCSRITLEVTGVRVERLHGISESDAKAEGVNRVEWSWDDGESPTNDRDGFECVWVAINGRDSWDANPWVWVVEFKRIQA